MADRIQRGDMVVITSPDHEKYRELAIVYQITDNLTASIFQRGRMFNHILIPDSKLLHINLTDITPYIFYHEQS